MQHFISTTIVVFFMMFFLSHAEAAITDYDVVEVNGVVKVDGSSDQAEGTPITWDGSLEATLNKKGKFSFYAPVPAACVAEVSDGNGTAIVPISNCTPAPPPTAGSLLKTGQTTCWDSIGQPIDCAGTGQDGEYQAGAPIPSPRFTDNEDGTVTDNLTGLTWLKDLFCIWGTWADGLTATNTLAVGNCGLSDGSVAGDWRMPNRNELMSLQDLGTAPVPLPAGHPFTNYDYVSVVWTSTTLLVDMHTDSAWAIDFAFFDTGTLPKSDFASVVPVRGGL